MWKTRLTNATSTSGALNVILSRDDVTFVISLSDWWIMSAAQYLANKALQENNLNFKADELYARGLKPLRRPTWTTDMVLNDEGDKVHLLRDGAIVVTFGLDEFAALSATQFVVEDCVDVASGLTAYGTNMKEVRRHIASEDGDLED